jgi:hypothetical protein
VFAVTVQQQEAATGETDEQARRRQALAQALRNYGLLEFRSGSVLPRLPVRGRRPPGEGSGRGGEKR